MDVPWTRQLVAGLSPQRSGFMPKLVRVGFIVNKMALGKVFKFFGFPVTFHHGFPYSCIIWEMNNRPVGDCRSGTRSLPIDVNYYSTV
jgi:hypothetical protein